MHTSKRTIYIKHIIIILIVSSLLLLACCSSQNPLYISRKNGMNTVSFLAMDTIIAISVDSQVTDKKLENAYYEIQQFENAYSAYITDSELYEINQSSSKKTEISEDLYNQILISQKVSEMTDGAFDITVLPLINLWGFSNGEYKVPKEAEIIKALETIGYEKIHLDDQAMLSAQGTNIDLGAVAKGYIGQKIADKLQEEGSSFGILSLGGNMQLYGKKPDGSNWNIAIQDPLDESSIIGIISTTDCSVITSGSYQRYFIENDIKYHHILDPKTGYPADNGLISVTIVAKDGAYADALSTALFVTGLEKGIEIWKEYNDFEAVFITEDKSVYITEGLKDRFTPESEDFLFDYVYK